MRQGTCSWLFPHVQKHLPKEGQIESPNLPKTTFWTFFRSNLCPTLSFRHETACIHS